MVIYLTWTLHGERDRNKLFTITTGGDANPLPLLEFWGRFAFGQARWTGRGITGSRTRRVSDVRGFAFGCLVTDGFGPLGPVLGLAREQVIRNSALALLFLFFLVVLVFFD